MSAPPRFSIITPSFQHARYIAKTIESVRDQDYPDFEHIVVDGGSTDGTAELLASYAGLRWTSEPDRGQTHAVNKGLRQATGEIVAYLNSDDVYRPGALAEAAAALDQAPQASAVVGHCDVIDDENRTVGFLGAQLDDPVDLLRYWRWGRGICVPQPAVFIRRRALEEVGEFDESFDMAMDLEMWLRLARHGSIRVVDQTLAAYRDTPQNKSNTRQGDMALESYRAARRHLRIAPAADRAELLAELRRQTAGHLLSAAEKSGESPRTWVWRALRCRPAILGSSRVWRLLLGLA